MSSSAAASLDRFALGDETPGSYQWWYFDAVSDDGRFGLVAIYFVGGVFSSLYADRLAAGLPASPLDHAMVNVALYDRGRRTSWVFSEYPRESLNIVDPELDLVIGRSRLTRDAQGRYDLDVFDRDFPRSRDLRLQVRVVPTEEGIAPPDGVLSPGARHFWGSPAPRCSVEVRSESLGLQWKGTGYHDVNRGLEPLHVGFREWNWGRTHLKGETRIVYDAVDADGLRTRHQLVGRNGTLQHEATHPPLPVDRSKTSWLLNLPRDVEFGLQDRVAVARRERLWEHSPFYARWGGVLTGEDPSAHFVCEHVDLARFARPSIRFMLRYRTYRRRPDGGAHPPHVSHRELFRHESA
jgi:carotenoid 1,2-hydratase